MPELFCDNPHRYSITDHEGRGGMAELVGRQGWETPRSQQSRESVRDAGPQHPISPFAGCEEHRLRRSTSRGDGKGLAYGKHRIGADADGSDVSLGDSDQDVVIVELQVALVEPDGLPQS